MSIQALTDEQIREIFVANGFTLKGHNLDGKPDLYPYVYSAARALLATVSDAQPNYVLMPRKLTAENGAKAALIGEFEESVEVGCMACDGDGQDSEGDGCEACEGEGLVQQNFTVGWDTIKAIYCKAVEKFAAAAPAVPVEAQPDRMTNAAREHGMDLGDNPVAYEFYNPRNGHAVVDYTRWTHVGHLTERNGYIARPLQYAAPAAPAVPVSDLPPLPEALGFMAPSDIEIIRSRIQQYRGRNYNVKANVFLDQGCFEGSATESVFTADQMREYAQAAAVRALLAEPAPDVRPSALTDEEVWDIYKHAVNKVRKTGNRKFAIALTREMIRLSKPSVESAPAGRCE